MANEPLRAIDANIILRYLLRDIPDQAERARNLIESEESLGLTVVVLAEVAWTLAGPRYRINRRVVAEFLIELLARENFEPVGFARADAQAALQACARDDHVVNFGDALIAACARSAGIEEIYSFDQRFARSGLTVIAPR